MPGVQIATSRASRQSTLRVGGVLSVLCLAALPGPTAAQELHGADYHPRALGYSWRYVDEFDPGQLYYEDVFGSMPYGGYSEAWLVGSEPCGLYLIDFNDGVSFVYLGGSLDCVEIDFDDIDLSVIVDGTTYDMGDDPGFTVIRLWENLDHDLTGDYGIDPNLTDVIVVVEYDGIWGPNDQNVVLESGGGTTYNAAVTDTTFYQARVGPIARVDVEASTGEISQRYRVVASFDCNGNQIADHRDIETGTSQDLNANGIPDECEVCRPDLTGDGEVDTRDFLLFLGAWSLQDPLADWDGDGTVNTLDFLAYLNDWSAGC